MLIVVSFLQLFRFSSVSRGYTLIFIFIVPFLLVVFRNSEFLSRFLGRNPSNENYISFNLGGTSVFRELRLLKFRKDLINFELNISKEEEEIMNNIEMISKKNLVIPTILSAILLSFFNSI